MNDVTWTLVIDTSFKGASMAIAKKLGTGHELVAQSQFFSNQIAAARLPQALNRFLLESECTIDDVKTILINNGPGSFTGIKVGLSFVSGLKLGQDRLNILGISGLESLSRVYPLRHWFLPATKTQGYLAMANSSGEPELFSVDLNNEIIEIAPENSDMQSEYSVDQGIQIEILQPWPKLEDLFKSKGMTFSQENLGINSAFIVNSILLSYDLGLKSVNTPPNPRYIRKSAPEEALEKKRKK